MWAELKQPDEGRAAREMAYIGAGAIGKQYDEDRKPSTTKTCEGISRLSVFGTCVCVRADEGGEGGLLTTGATDELLSCATSPSQGNGWLKSSSYRPARAS